MPKHILDPQPMDQAPISDGAVGLAGALLGQTPAACWNLQILIHLYKKDDRSIFSMLLSSLDCLCAPGGDDLVALS